MAGIQKQNISTKLFGLILMLSPVVIGMSILIAIEPQVVRSTLNYRSAAGWFGISGILNLIGADSLINFYRNFSAVIILLLLVISCRQFYSIKNLNPKQIISFCFLIILFIPTFGPGYGPQYISWFLPSGVILFLISEGKMKRIFIIGYLIATITYIIEYAFFTSHGAFITKMIKTEQVQTISTLFTTQKMQVLIRLPLFLFLAFIFIYLIKDMKLSKKSIDSLS
jgi:hypothetical protein